MQTITGKIVKFIPCVEGESQSGKHWVRAGVVIEYGEEYPAKAAFSIFGEERINNCKGLQEGMMVQVNYNPQSREYNDRWYTDLQCIGIYPIQQQQPAAQQQPPQQAQPTAQKPQYPDTFTAQPTATTMQEDDELPF